MRDERKKPVRLIGIPPGGRAPAGLLAGCVAAAAAARHRAMVPDGMDFIALSPVAAALDAVAAGLERGPVAVLAGGDPLFFGIGRRLIERFGRGRVEVFPAVSAVQVLAAGTGRSWDDAAFLSLHGRPLADAAARLLMAEKTFVFTDRKNTPAAIAAAMLGRLGECGCAGLARDYRLTVGEDLGGAGQRIREMSLERAAAAAFADPNLLLVEGPARGPVDVFPGEEEVVHSRGLITKDEVRAAAVAALAPPATGVLWDLGAGSGSVGLACALLRPRLAVYAVERRPEEIENVRANTGKFRAFNLTPVPAAAPEALRGLPDPDRVFVGGSGGRLAEILAAARDRLGSGGRLVVNAVLDESAETAVAMMSGFGMRPRAARIAVTRRAGDEVVEMNPVTVITGVKP